MSMENTVYTLLFRLSWPYANCVESLLCTLICALNLFGVLTKPGHSGVRLGLGNKAKNRVRVRDHGLVIGLGLG